LAVKSLAAEPLGARNRRSAHAAALGAGEPGRGEGVEQVQLGVE
jgi:hypothetical protein